MKLFISDYDGTYLRKDEHPNEALRRNAEQVHQWQAEGNWFGFSTGRILPLMEKEEAVQALTPDVMIVANGALVLDAQGKVLYHQTIPQDVSQTLLTYLTQQPLNFICSDGRDGYLTPGVLTSPTMGCVFESLQETGCFRLDMSQVLTQGISQVSIIDLTPEEREQLRRSLEPLFGEDVTIYPNRTSIDISPKQSSKAIGVAKALEYFNLTQQQVVCMGDSWNDLEMLEQYHGLTVPEAPEEIKAVSNAFVSSVEAGLKWVRQKKTK